MALDKRYRNSILSILLFGVLFVIADFIFVDDFAGIGLMFLTELVALFVGALYIVFGRVKFIDTKTDFIYNYLGTLNLILGGLSLVFALINGGSSLLLVIALNLFIGIFIYWEIYKSNNTNRKVL